MRSHLEGELTDHPGKVDSLAEVQKILENENQFVNHHNYHAITYVEVAGAPGQCTGEVSR